MLAPLSQRLAPNRPRFATTVAPNVRRELLNLAPETTTMMRLEKLFEQPSAERLREVKADLATVRAVLMAVGERMGFRNARATAAVVAYMEIRDKELTTHGPRASSTAKTKLRWVHLAYTPCPWDRGSATLSLNAFASVQSPLLERAHELRPSCFFWGGDHRAACRLLPGGHDDAAGALGRTRSRTAGGGVTASHLAAVHRRRWSGGHP